ncbi:MAG: MBL fold metallo-hydrolase [Treponema sp.]|nr:MBL fold metallo-hydrolase [Treponema sp.]
MKMTLMGTGTSHGVPVIGCNCPVCTSTDPHDNRLRCSALIEHENLHFLIDVGPDFRFQALRHKINRLDAVFITHSHADHLHGIDDLRIFSHKNSFAMSKDAALVQKYPETDGEGLPVYTSERTKGYIHERFPYIFVDHDKGGGIPKLHLIAIDQNTAENPLIIQGQASPLQVVQIPMIHGNHHTNGYIFSITKDGIKKSIAYLTDCNFISDQSISQIKKAGGQIENLIIDALREKSHSSHCNFLEALSYADKIGARRTWFTHMTHDMSHEDIKKYIEGHLKDFPNLEKTVRDGGSVSPAYDGLILEI